MKVGCMNRGCYSPTAVRRAWLCQPCSRSSVVHMDTHCHLEQRHALLQGAAQLCSWGGPQCFCGSYLSLPNPTQGKKRFPTFWTIRLSDFPQAFIEMAAYVCMHAWCSLILHTASQLSCFRRTFHTVKSGKRSEMLVLF